MYLCRHVYIYVCILKINMIFILSEGFLVRCRKLVRVGFETTIHLPNHQGAMSCFGTVIGNSVNLAKVEI